MLTEKQENFCKCIAIEHMTYTDAYIHSYNTKNMKKKTINENASRLARDSKIIARIKELRDQVAEQDIISAKERLKLLSDIATGKQKEKYKYDGEEYEKEPSSTDKIRAIDTMNKMDGTYTTKTESNITIQSMETWGDIFGYGDKE